MTSAKIPRPLESFAPELLKALLRGALEPFTLYAEANKAAPRLFDKNDHHAPSAGDHIVSTRWHIVAFSNTEAAGRFREFQRLAQRLHALRISMKYYAHPDADKVYAVRISLDDRKGTLQIAPADIASSALLNEIHASNSATTDLMQDFNDPLERLSSNE